MVTKCPPKNKLHFVRSPSKAMDEDIVLYTKKVFKYEKVQMLAWHPFALPICSHLHEFETGTRATKEI